MLCVANLARSVQPVELDLSRFKGMTPVEMLGLTEFPRIGDAAVLPDARHRMRSTGSACEQAPPGDHRARGAGDADRSAATLPALLVGAAWETLLDGNVRTLIERDMLLPFLQRQRWFGGKARAIARRALRRLGTAAARAAAALRHDRRGGIRGRQPRSATSCR